MNGIPGDEWHEGYSDGFKAAKTVILPEEVLQALETFKAQDGRKLDWFYEGGEKDAMKVATILARHLLSSRDRATDE